MAELLPQVALSNVNWSENPARTPLNLEVIFPKKEHIFLEIGFGGGEHLAHLATHNPNIGFLGCEPYLNGVATLLGKIRRDKIKNIRLHAGDIRDLFDVLPDEKIDRVFLLYPDPWPKKRHHRRRFVTPEFLDPLARVMKPNAKLFVATDIGDYVRQSLEVLSAHPEFTWCAQAPADWREPWPNWYPTRYEKKALREGRKPYYLQFEKINGSPDV